jgi:toxin-antitoxin system PIN domain toxin
VTVHLLDVNVLIALLDPAHVQHDQAHEWFAEEGAQAWASCPLTQNGLLRIVGHPRYPGSPGSPAAVAHLAAGLFSLPGHEFWPDDVSLLDAALVDATRLLTSAQVTDSYLLALARAHGGRLATLDRRLVASAVRGGGEALRVIG